MNYQEPLRKFACESSHTVTQSHNGVRHTSTNRLRIALERKLSQTMLDALRAARGAGGLWYWPGGFWLPTKNAHRPPTAAELEGGWFTSHTINALVKRNLLWRAEWPRVELTLDAIEQIFEGKREPSFRDGRESTFPQVYGEDRFDK